MPRLSAQPKNGQTLSSAHARWTDLVQIDASHRDGEFLPADTPNWTRSMTVRTRRGGQKVVSAGTAREDDFFLAVAPWRDFRWRTAQTNRPGLQYMVSTGRMNGFESVQERRLLDALDFDGRVVDLICQPLELVFSAGLRNWRHVPDYLVGLNDGRKLLLNVRPQAMIDDPDRVKFAAADRLAAARGWAHEVVCGYVEPARSTVNAVSAARRPQADPFGITPELLEAARQGPLPFGDLVARTSHPALARRLALGLVWDRVLSVDLAVPLEDTSLVTLADGHRGTASR